MPPRGTDDATDLLAWSLDFAGRAAGYYDIIPAAFAEIESAWLAGRSDSTAAPVQRVLAFTGAGLLPRHRGELQRWLRRLGRPAETFPGCPEAYAAGIRGDWRAAAAEWERIGAPYQRALELLDSGDVDATIQAFAALDALGAARAAQIARRRLRELGVSQVPRGPKPTTKANPAGLTERQIEILQMLASGSTNAEIAANLVVSVRTVDHHVSAVPQKLGLTTRRQAAKAAADLGLEPERH